MILMVAIIDRFILILCKLIAASIYSLKKIAASIYFPACSVFVVRCLLFLQYGSFINLIFHPKKTYGYL